ncbi:MAG: DNA polymerase III subunit delta [Chitinophagaceae bacterium]|nr:MAG: DNA polymerase III subunit delta [Chitinophagaceae bacterium]
MEVKKYEELLKNIKAGSLMPVYFLYGKEEYFIDLVTDFLCKTVIPDHEKDFNQHIFYGKDITASQITDLASGFPMMGEKQLIVIKEAQSLTDLSDLEAYIKSPVDTTILLLAYKNSKIDKRKNIFKQLRDSKLVAFYESKAFTKDFEMTDWVNRKLQTEGFSIENDALQLLLDHIGLNVTQMANALSKLTLSNVTDKRINKDVIEKNIGISKEYNPFELQNAIGAGQKDKAYKIAWQMSKDPKNNNIYSTLTLLFLYFHKVYTLHYVQKSYNNDQQLASVLSIPPFFLKQYKQAAAKYSVDDIEYIFDCMRKLDLKLKGVGSKVPSNEAAYIELVDNILDAPRRRLIYESKRWSVFLND